MGVVRVRVWLGVRRVERIDKNEVQHGIGSGWWTSSISYALLNDD